MGQAIPLVLVLSLALGAHGLTAQKCNLTGYWKNDLGSVMIIMSVDEDSSFTGSYNTSVAAKPSKIQPSPLLGFQHLTNSTDQSIFGFTVNWTFSASITVFTGQCFVDKNGKEVLKTMWLLRSHTNKNESDWKATRVGTNVFHRLEQKMD